MTTGDDPPISNLSLATGWPPGGDTADDWGYIPIPTGGENTQAGGRKHRLRVTLHAFTLSTDLHLESVKQPVAWTYVPGS